MAGVCTDPLLIEAMVCDARVRRLRLEDETKTVNQALRGLGAPSEFPISRSI
jgi:hypothetical protein